MITSSTAAPRPVVGFGISWIPRNPRPRRRIPRTPRPPVARTRRTALPRTRQSARQSRRPPPRGRPPPAPRLVGRRLGARLRVARLLGGLLRRGRLDLLLGDALGVDRDRLGRRRDHEVVLDAPAALGDAGALADPAAQVVELRPPHVAAGDDLELLDLRRVDREGALDADAERLLADRERLPRAAALAPDHDPLEHLGAPPRPLDHLEVHPHPVAGGKARDLPQLALLDALDDRAHE